MRYHCSGNSVFLPPDWRYPFLRNSGTPAQEYSSFNNFYIYNYNNFPLIRHHLYLYHFAQSFSIIIRQNAYLLSTDLFLPIPPYSLYYHIIRITNLNSIDDSTIQFIGCCRIYHSSISYINSYMTGFFR